MGADVDDRAGAGSAAAADRPTMPSEVWVLVAGAFVVALGFGLIAPVLPTYAASFGVSTAAVSFIVSAFALSRLLFAPVAGRLLGRLSERPVYLTGLLIVAASSAAIAYAPGYSGLLIARGLGGFGSAMFTIAGMALLIRVTPAALRGRASANYASGFLLGSIFGPLFGGWLVGWSVKAPFLSYAALLLVAAAVVQVALRRLPDRPRDTTLPVASLREAIRRPEYRAALSAQFVFGWAVLGIRMALIPLFVARVLGATEDVAGYALTAFAIGNAAALTPVGRWVDRAGRKPAMLIGLTVSAASIGFIGITTSVWQLLALSVVGGLGSGLITPAQNAVVADVLGHRSGGSVLALYQMVGDVGAVIGPVLAGYLVDQSGFGLALGTAGGVIALTILFWLRAPETLPAKSGNITTGPQR